MYPSLRPSYLMEAVPVESPQHPPPAVQGLSHEGSAQSPPRHDAQVPVLHDPSPPAASESAAPASQTPETVNSAATTALQSSPEVMSSHLSVLDSRSFIHVARFHLDYCFSHIVFGIETRLAFALEFTPHYHQLSDLHTQASEASSTASIRGSAAPHNISFYLGIALAAIAGLSFLIAILAWWLRIRRPRTRHRQPLYFPFPEHPPKKPPSVMTETDKRVPKLPNTRRLLQAPLDPQATPRPPLRRLPTALQHSDASVPALTHDIGTPCIANLVSGDILFSDSSASASRPASAAPSLSPVGHEQGDRMPRCVPPAGEVLPLAWASSAGADTRSGSGEDMNLNSDSEAALPLVRPMSPKAQRGTWAGALRMNIASAFSMFSGHGTQAPSGAVNTAGPQAEATSNPSPPSVPCAPEEEEEKNDIRGDSALSMPGKLISPFSDAAVSLSSDSASSRYSVASDALAPLPPTMHRGGSVSSQTQSSDGHQVQHRDEGKAKRRSRPSLAHLHSSFGTSATSVGSDMTRASSRHGRLTEREEAARRALRERRKRVSRARIEALREKNERLVQARVEAAKAL
ncbi:hypothetical protein EVG20_g8449 [Dentipellis fragilis]|uniref:Uncharacterized protein n=1 Tax=Dentipellis fragilis TaxID=205917 RepID=A0A4Y9Y6Z8_9AGAM|nr:hypothetical protein EVG20_g8449 [Dentipellis fragilis]